MAAQIEGMGRQALPVQMDVTKMDEIRALNGIAADSTDIFTGQKLIIRLPGSATPPAPASLPATPAPFPASAPSTGTNPLATTGLVLGIFSITIGLCCCYGFPFNLAGAACSAIALVMACRIHQVA